STLGAVVRRPVRVVAAGLSDRQHGLRGPEVDLAVAARDVPRGQQERRRLSGLVEVAGAAQAELHRARGAVGKARPGTRRQRVARAHPGGRAAPRVATRTAAGTAVGRSAVPGVAVGAVVTRTGRRATGVLVARLVPAARRLTDRRTRTRRSRGDGRRGILAVGPVLVAVAAPAAR